MLARRASALWLILFAAMYGCDDPTTDAADGGQHDGGVVEDAGEVGEVRDAGEVRDSGRAQDGGEVGGDADVGGDAGRDGGQETSACLTGGSGGATEDLYDQNFTDSRGQSSKFHIYAGKVDTSGRVGLALFMHGDGAYSFDHPEWITDDLATRAAASELLFVALRTPNPSRGTTWWRDGSDNADWVRDLLEDRIFPEYDIDRSRVLIVGYSGGALFTTQYLVPGHSDLFCGGGALPFGGGGGPNPRDLEPFAPEFIESFRLHFYTGMMDTGCADCSCDGYDAYSHSQEGVSWYRNRGFTVTAEHPPDIHHCNIQFGRILSEQLAAGLVPPPR